MLTRSLVIMILRLFAAYQLINTITITPTYFRLATQMQLQGPWNTAMPVISGLLFSGLILIFAPRIAGFFGAEVPGERLDPGAGVSHDTQRMIMQTLGVIFCMISVPELISSLYHAGWIAPRSIYPHTPLATRLMQNIHLLIQPGAMTLMGFYLLIGADHLVRLLRRLRPMRTDEN